MKIKFNSTTQNFCQQFSIVWWWGEDGKRIKIFKQTKAHKIALAIKEELKRNFLTAVKWNEMRRNHSNVAMKLNWKELSMKKEWLWK